MANQKKLTVEREAFDLNGKTCHSYFVKGTVCGQEIKAQFIPQDNGGYVILDIVFGDKDTAELVVSSMSITNDKGRTETFPTYTIRNVGNDGVVYECPVKVSRKTDKTKIAMLLK